jgi:tellurite resistance protein
MIMGLAGLTIAWEKAQHLSGVNLHINSALVGFTSALFIALILLYSSKAVLHRHAVATELKNPVKLNFFPTISISLLLLAISFLPLNTTVSQLLWVSGAVLHLLFTLHVVNVWMHNDHFQIQHMNPAWFIPAVGNVLVPIAGIPLGFVDVSWFFFSIGMLFWMVLFTIIFYRVLFHNPIDEKLMPTLFILVAPPAVGFIAYTQLAGEIDAFARLLYFSALFLTLVLFSQTRRFLALRFFLSWWAYSFPLAAISIASMVMFEHSGVVFYGWIGAGLLALLTGVVAMLFVRTAMAVYRHKVCLPGH